MQLYVSSITNLSDARFFSAYGVHFFGFCFDVLDANAVTIDKAKEITSWLHEPKVIGQFGDHQSFEEMQFVHSQLPMHAVQISESHPERNSITLPKWIAINEGISDELSSGLFLSADWTKEALEDVARKHPHGIHIACSKNSHVEYYAELMEIIEPYLN